MNLGDFIDSFKDAIAQRVVESYPPLYRPSENGGALPRLLRTPLGAQADAIKGAALSLQAHRGTTVVGEMGTDFKRYLCPLSRRSALQRMPTLSNHANTTTAIIPRKNPSKNHRPPLRPLRFAMYAAMMAQISE